MVSFQRKIKSISINHRCSQFQILRSLRFLLSEDKLRYPRSFVCDIECKNNGSLHGRTLIRFEHSRDVYTLRRNVLQSLQSSRGSRFVRHLNFYGLFWNAILESHPAFSLVETRATPVLKYWDNPDWWSCDQISPRHVGKRDLLTSVSAKEKRASVVRGHRILKSLITSRELRRVTER